MLDVVLAIVHHLIVFALLAVLVTELVLIQPDMKAPQMHRAGTVDAAYGVLAAAILVVGFTRAVYAAKGWAYYSGNLFFWAKIGAFLVVGLLSAVPTVRLMQWRLAEKRAPGTMPSAAEIAQVRRLLSLEVAVFALIPVFAALMARGYGER
jgi:putative membrane protein